MLARERGGNYFYNVMVMIMIQDWVFFRDYARGFLFVCSCQNLSSSTAEKCQKPRSTIPPVALDLAFEFCFLVAGNAQWA